MENKTHSHNHLSKLVVFLLVLGVAFIGGMFVGKGLGFMKYRTQGMSMMYKNTPDNLMYFNSQGGTAGMPMMTTGYGNMMVSGATAFPGKRISGVISAVDGTKITVTDNGGVKQEVYSTSDTTIYGENGMLALSALKSGQFVSVNYTEKAGKKTASIIQVQ